MLHSLGSWVGGVLAIGGLAAMVGGARFSALAPLGGLATAILGLVVVEATRPKS